MERHRQNTTRKARARKVSLRGKRSAKDSYSGRKAFVEAVLAYHQEHGRHMLPWRIDVSPYKVLVSELMLQQTQVERVVPKFIAFMERFPTIDVLASAPQKDVLIMWQGLGYNRRARYLHQAAQRIQQLGDFPKTLEGLKALPGIGPYTAGAIRAFAYNEPEVFLETNIRAVLIDHFFPRNTAVIDSVLTPILHACMESVQEPRIWYAALMDFGTHIKQTRGNATRRSTTYTKQSAFKGSQREIRGSVIRTLSRTAVSLETLLKKHPPERHQQVYAALADLLKEALIEKQKDMYSLL